MAAEPVPPVTEEKGSSSERGRVLPVGDLTPLERYQLVTSLVVPRPIGWISTADPLNGPNLAPFSFYTALSASPMLVAVSMGSRRGEPKDTLRNVRATGAFCVNVVGEEQLGAMVETAGDFGPNVDEADRAGLALSDAETVDAPYVTAAPAVLECGLSRIVELDGPNTLVIGAVAVVRLSSHLRLIPGTRVVDAASLRPVGRLHGRSYGLLGPIRSPAPDGGEG